MAVIRYYSYIQNLIGYNVWQSKHNLHITVLSDKQLFSSLIAPIPEHKMHDLPPSSPIFTTSLQALSAYSPKTQSLDLSLRSHRIPPQNWRINRLALINTTRNALDRHGAHATTSHLLERSNRQALLVVMGRDDSAANTATFQRSSNDILALDAQ